MTRGIWGDPERYLETYWRRFPGVWTHGDWASRDDDGYWFLHGRSDDTLNVAGKRIGPAEIESAVATHPAVAESAAVGVPDAVKGESIACVVVLRDAGAEPGPRSCRSCGPPCESISAARSRRGASCSSTPCPRRGARRSCAASCERG